MGFSAAPENLLVVNVGELFWEFQTMKVLSVLGNTTSAGLPSSRFGRFVLSESRRWSIAQQFASSVL